MFTANFARPERIESEAKLRSIFRSDRLYLGQGSAVVFEGVIALGPEVKLGGECSFSAETRIDNGSILENVYLGSGNVIRAYSLLSNVTAGNRNLFGPFCFVRDDCLVGDECTIGAHVEATRSTFANGVKISHRAFVGDAQIGEQVIIGAGVVFCNFDDKGRQPTKIGARVTVGSGSLLVPPLIVGDDVVIGAGSTVTKDVAPSYKLIQKRVSTIWAVLPIEQENGLKDS